MTKAESSRAPEQDEPTGYLLEMKTTERSETCNDGETKRATSDMDDTYQEQSAAKVILLLVSILISMFLVALDRTIISTV
jgi:hypothetical protein